MLKGTHLPLMIKEIQAGYLSSSYFKDIYLCLVQNRLPVKKAAIKRLLALLAIPEICADKIITLYHSNLFAGHQGVIKTYLMISDTFYIPNLMHYLRSYIKGLSYLSTE